MLTATRTAKEGLFLIAQETVSYVQVARIKGGSRCSLIVEEPSQSVVIYREEIVIEKLRLGQHKFSPKQVRLIRSLLKKHGKLDG